MANAADAGPNDIIIHLVNPYKCTDCGGEFFSRNSFIEHMAEHIDKMKAQNPCYQIVCGVSLATQQGNSITVTRDILQINENQMFELQDTSLDYTQLTPLRVLEQAGILNLPQPHKVSSDVITNVSNDCVNSNESRDQGTNTISLPHQTLHQEISLIHREIENSQSSNLLKSQGGQGSVLPVMGENLHSQNPIPHSGHAANLEPVIQPPYIMNEALKEELNVIIEAPVNTSGLPGQEQFTGLQEVPVEGLKGMKNWAEGDLEAIMAGKHIVLVKKVLTPNYDEPRRGRTVCKICYNEFANKNVLMRHQVVHTGIKPHCCFTCFKEFNDISSLRKHLLIHKRSHKCPICLKMFLRRRQMELHLRQHNKKRFIQFGHKYHEVQVSTCRNEQEQIVHEFSLSALMNVNNKVNNITNTDSAGNNSTDVSHLGSKNSNGFDNSVPDDKPVGTESVPHVSEAEILPNESGTHEDEAAACQIKPTSSTSQTTFKKVIYKCGHCKKLIYTRPTLSRHLMLHTNEKPFNCEKCGKDFRHKSDLVHHYKTHLKPVKCQTCGSAFSKRLYLKKHLEKGCPFMEENNKNFTLLSDLTYQCNLCHKILKSRANVFRHLRVHAFEERKFQEPDTKKVSKMIKEFNDTSEGDNTSDISSKDVNDFIQPLSNCVGFQCTICGEEFRFKSFILIHVRMHLNQRPFLCKECGCGFFGRYQLRKHQQNHTRPYKCPKCGKGFNRRYLMTHHFNKNHSEDSEEKMKDITILPDKKLLRCDICGKTMKSYQKSLMQYHIRLHKDVRPYQCQECQKTFISDIALKKHSLNHSKPYVCQVCGKGFSRRYLMIEHFEKNCKSKRPGPKSGSSTTFNSSLEKIVNEKEFDSGAPYEAETGTEFNELRGAEMFRCVPCDKTFMIKEALVRHVKTFKRRTPCKYCKQEFSDKHLTLAHQRCCLGFGMEIKKTDSSKRNKTLTQRQETVLKVMEEINKKIENYAVMIETRKEVSQDKNDPIQSTEITKQSLPTEDKEKDDNSSTSAPDTDNHKRTTPVSKKRNKYPCPECNKTFLTTRGLKIHASSHVRLYQCEICGHDFTQIKAFRDHMKLHSSSNEKFNSSNDNLNNPGESEEITLKVTSQEVELTLNEESNSTKTNFITTHTLEEFPDKKIKQTNSKLGSAVVKNVDVVRSKEQIDVTARLMLSGTRGRPFSCKQCRRRFTEETRLMAHVSQIHGIKKME